MSRRRPAAGDALEQPGHLAPLELRGRFVEDDESRALAQGSGDLDDLALLDAEAAASSSTSTSRSQSSSTRRALRRRAFQPIQPALVG